MNIKFNPFLKEELTVKDLHFALLKEEITSKELVMFYMDRIAKFDKDGPNLNAIIEINPHALFIAEAMDYERKKQGMRGLLHGIPVLLKDNIETNDSMHTSAGSLALESYISNQDAFLVEKLRQSGAIILGKTNMTEWANGMSSTMWAGYSSRGGQTLNPYGDEKLFVGGSSSGSAVAVAANFAVLAVGTETDASILSPAIQNSVVGIKPTVGLISREGIIPFTYSQDTPGPIARTVADAAILLGAITGVDLNDVATFKIEGITCRDYTPYLDSTGLMGARIGILHNADERFYNSEEYDDKLFKQAVYHLKEEGAEVIEDIEIPSFHRKWCREVLLHEFKHSVDNYLSKLPTNLPVHSLSELIEFNKKNQGKNLKYGQNMLELREDLSNTLTAPEYLKARSEDLYFSQEKGIDYTLQKYNLDAIVFPSYIGSTISAKAGYPSIAVPAGYMNSGKPFGITFAGTAFSEGILIKLAYAYEQATKHRISPKI